MGGEALPPPVRRGVQRHSFGRGRVRGRLNAAGERPSLWAEYSANRHTWFPSNYVRRPRSSSLCPSPVACRFTREIPTSETSYETNWETRVRFGTGREVCSGKVPGPTTRDREQLADEIDTFTIRKKCCPREPNTGKVGQFVDNKTSKCYSTISGSVRDRPRVGQEVAPKFRPHSVAAAYNERGGRSSGAKRERERLEAEASNA